MSHVAHAYICLYVGKTQFHPLGSKLRKQTSKGRHPTTSINIDILVFVFEPAGGVSVLFDQDAVVCDFDENWNICQLY